MWQGRGGWNLIGPRRKPPNWPPTGSPEAAHVQATPKAAHVQATPKATPKVLARPKAAHVQATPEATPQVPATPGHAVQVLTRSSVRQQLVALRALTRELLYALYTIIIDVG